jgi:hypothetical protein
VAFDPEKDTIVGEVYQSKLGVLFCRACQRSHPFFINPMGTMSLVTPCNLVGDRRAFCKKHKVDEKLLIKHSIVICPCGAGLKIDYGPTEEEMAETAKKAAAENKDQPQVNSVEEPQVDVDELIEEEDIKEPEMTNEPINLEEGEHKEVSEDYADRASGSDPEGEIETPADMAAAALELPNTTEEAPNESD